MSATEKEYKINEQQTSVDIFIENDEGYRYQFNWNSVHELTIVNDLLNWVWEGTMVINDQMHLFERLFDSPEKRMLGQHGVNEVDVIRSIPYLFKNDNSDILHVTIKPKFRANDTSVPMAMIDDYWCLNGEFVVYDKTDLPLDRDDRLKALKFVDKDLVAMREIHPQWSTATSTLNTQIKNQNTATDDDRAMYTGVAIRSLLIDNGFEVDEDHWDNGSTKIYYSTYGNTSLESAIKYLLSHHISEKGNDICFFNKDYVTKKYRLISITDYLKMAGNQYKIPGEWQTEHFYMTTTSDSKTLPSPYKAPNKPIADTNPNWDATLAPLDSYEYIDAVPEAATSINIPQIIVAHNNYKQFIVDCTATEMKTSKIIKETYIPQLYTYDGQPITKFNDNAREFVNTNISYIPYWDERMRSRYGIAKSVYNKIFTSGGIIIQAEGRYFRRVGVFVGLDRIGFTENDFDRKFLGQWFITTVVHKFNFDKYKNRMYGVKVHTYSPLGNDKVGMINSALSTWGL